MEGRGFRELMWRDWERENHLDCKQYRNKNYNKKINKNPKLKDKRSKIEKPIGEIK